MRQVRRIMATCALIAAASLAATACGSEEPTSTNTAPVTSVPANATPAPNGVGGAPVETGTDGSLAPAVEAPDQPANSGAVTVPPAPNRDDVNVDARDFEQAGGQYFFTSPSGNAFCAFNSSNAPGTVVGCQVETSVPGNTARECANTATNTYGVQITTGGTVEQICTNQGIFVGDANGNGVQVLQYGQVIGVTGTFCRSTEGGIACYDGSESGFLISRDVNLAF